MNDGKWILILSILFLIGINMSSCKVELLNVDEEKLLGRWEVVSKSTFNNMDEFMDINEDVCEWSDTYTFLNESVLFCRDSIRERVDSCGESTEFKMIGEWEQSKNGEFIFTFTRKSDKVDVVIGSKKVYFENNLLVIELSDDDTGSSNYSRITLSKI